MATIDIEIRRAVMLATTGNPSTYPAPADEHARIRNLAQDFARSKLIKLDVQSQGDALIMNAVGRLTSTAKYSEADDLDIGESITFEVPPREAQNVRSLMSYRGRRDGRLYQCTNVPGGVKVTRLEAQAAAPKASKYGLERLETEKQLRIDVPRADHHKVRLAAHRKACQTGWVIRCRLQDDGTMVVYRTDAGAPTTTPE